MLITSLLAVSWLGAMGVHELGHVVGAYATGGEVTRVVWHPLALSRTDVALNDSPGVVVWCGPIVGVGVPLLIAALSTACRRPWAYLLWFFAGACCVINGSYIGIGGFDGVGDTGEMLRTGSPLWVLVVFGAVTGALGLLIWHRVSPRLGFGRTPEPIDPLHACVMAVIAVGAIVFLGVLGDAG